MSKEIGCQPVGADFNVAPPLTTLCRKLLEAHFLSLHPVARSDHGRKAGGIALNAVIEFIEAIPGWRELGLTRPLHELNAAIIDVDRGTPSPMLTPVRAKNRAMDTLNANKLKFCAAVIMETYMHAKLTKAQAAAKTARLLGKYRQSSGKAITPATVVAWRDQLIGRTKGDFADSFRKHQETLKAMTLAGKAPSVASVKTFAKDLLAKHGSRI